MGTASAEYERRIQREKDERTRQAWQESFYDTEAFAQSDNEE